MRSFPSLALSLALLASTPLMAQPAETHERDMFALEAANPTAKKAVAKPSSAAKKDFVILKVEGDEINNSEAEALWKDLFPGGNAPEFSSFDESIRQNVLRGMVSEKLIYDEAVKAGFNESEAVQKRMESLRKQLVLQAYMEEKAKALVSDEQLKKAYDAKVASLNDEQEVRARHILVKDEAEAKALLKKLKKGEDFEALAKEKSIDKASGMQGGDLGYFTQDRMVPAFAKAAYALEMGELSEPVKTQFGWHIIRLEDKRAMRVPALEEMREELQEELSHKAVQGYVEKLIKNADITYFDAAGKPKPFTREIEAP